MSAISDLVRSLGAAGATAEMIAIAIEAVEATLEASRVQGRERQRRHREKVTSSNVMSRDVTPPLSLETKGFPEPLLKTQTLSLVPSPPKGSPSQEKSSSLDEPFEAVWKTYPHHKGRSSRPKSLTAWRKLSAEHRDGMLAAVTRYRAEGREPRMDCGARAFEGWLNDQRFLDWLAKPPNAATAVATTPEVEASRRQHYRDTGEWKTAWGPKPQGIAA